MKKLIRNCDSGVRKNNKKPYLPDLNPGKKVRSGVRMILKKLLIQYVISETKSYLENIFDIIEVFLL